MRRTGALASTLYESIEVPSVDTFRGCEKDFILVSFVLSSESQGIGFLSDSRRLNVAEASSSWRHSLAFSLQESSLGGVVAPCQRLRYCLVKSPLNNLQQSYMTFARPRRNPASDSRYAFTALARGAWDGRSEDRRDRPAPGFGRNRQSDSRFDPQYSSRGTQPEEPRNPGNGVAIPSFAPLPSYAGGEDLSSVGGDRTVDSQFGASPPSFRVRMKFRHRLKGLVIANPGPLVSVQEFGPSAQRQT